MAGDDEGSTSVSNLESGVRELRFEFAGGFAVEADAVDKTHCVLTCLLNSANVLIVSFKEL